MKAWSSSLEKDGGLSRINGNAVKMMFASNFLTDIAPIVRPCWELELPVDPARASPTPVPPPGKEGAPTSTRAPRESRTTRMEAPDWASLPVPDLDSLHPPPSAADPVESMGQQMAAVEHAVEGTLQQRFLDASIACSRSAHS